MSRSRCCIVLLRAAAMSARNISSPQLPSAPAFKESAPAAYSSAPPGTWQPAQPQDAMLKGKWWEMFNEPELNALEEQLNIDNQNIKQFFQNFMAARAQVREARAGYFPTRDGESRAQQDRDRWEIKCGTPSTTSNGVSNYSLPLEASWAPDLWGRVRNTVREFQYAAQVSAADLENERLTEQAALAEFYFELRGQDALQDLYNRTIEADRKALDLTRALVETGIDSPEAVAQAEVTLQERGSRGHRHRDQPGLYEHAIATLIGKPASSFSMPVKILTTPVPAIPVGVLPIAASGVRISRRRNAPWRRPTR